MIDVVIFELENVLFDTRELRRLAVTAACAAEGIPVSSAPDVIDGRPTRAAVRAILSGNAERDEVLDEVLVDLIASRANRAFSEQLAQGGVSLARGAASFVAAATGAARLAIVTRAARADAELLLRLSGFDGVFAVVITGDDVLDEKPSAEGYRAARERLIRQRPVRRGALIALEDGLAGIRAAHAADARCIAVGAMPAHIAMEAEAFIATLADTTLEMLDTLSTAGAERVR